MSTLRTAELTLASRVASRANAYVALTKPDVSFLVLITTAAGFYMGSRGPVDWLHMVHTVFGTMLIAAGTAALNHYIERDSDRLMRRTASRPLPSGVLKPRQALVYGIALSIAGALYLYFAAGTLAAGLGVITCLGYLLAYTPLKKRTVWATFVGAFPGAIPPMIGWVAATGRLDLGAWLLFAILFFWQYCLDVSGRLCASGDSDAAGGRSQRLAHVPADFGDCGRACRSQPAAGDCWAGRNDLFLWSAAAQRGSIASVCMGGQCEDEFSSQMAYARHRCVHSIAACSDGLRQDPSLIFLGRPLPLMLTKYCRSLRAPTLRGSG